MIYDVFLSYRRSDGEAIAKSLYTYFSQRGLRVFFDQEKMEDGHYFTTQIKEKLRLTPHYVFVATRDAFAFRESEDWLLEEIKIAIEEYEKAPSSRTLCVLVPEELSFPQKNNLPDCIQSIFDAQREILPFGEEPFLTYGNLLKAVTTVNRRNLWLAAQRWLENAQRPGNRFAHLHIDETIMPTAEQRKSSYTGFHINIIEDENEKARISLLKAISNVNESIYLIGQGGMGKTTALMRIMNEAYQGKGYTDNSQIPIFIELSFAPDTVGKHSRPYENGESTFIRRSIFQQLRADLTLKQVSEGQVSAISKVFTLEPEVAVDPITDILSRKTPAPEYLLLLDGLNEVSRTVIPETGRSVIDMVIGEIRDIIEKCPNVRVIITSRADQISNCGENLTKLVLCGLDDTQVLTCLRYSGMSDEEINVIGENTCLMQVLHVPLFLMLYTSLRERGEAETAGEILRLFFHERRRNIRLYTVQDHLENVQRDLESCGIRAKKLDATMQFFILDFLLPEIAWKMVQDSSFYLPISEIEKIIVGVLTDYNDIAVCGNFGKELFSKYTEGGTVKHHTKRTAKQIANNLGDDAEEVAESIVDCCIYSLGVMQQNGGRFGFIHQHIRDYFASVKVANSLRLAVYLWHSGEASAAIDCMNMVFKGKALDTSICKFLGESLGEHQNRPNNTGEFLKYCVPEKNCDRSLIDSAINLYRGKKAGEIGYGVYNLIEVLKRTREDLSGMNLRELDFSGCTFQNIVLGHRGLGADLQYGHINSENLFPIGHRNCVKKVLYSPNGKQIITASEDHSAMIWDAETGVQLHKLSGHTKSINSIMFNPQSGSQVVTTSEDGIAIVWNTTSGEKVHTIAGHRRAVLFAEFSQDGKRIVTASEDGTAIIWNTSTWKKVCAIRGHRAAIGNARFSPDRKLLVTASQDGTSKIWDISQEMGNQCIATCEHSDWVFSACFNSDGSRFVTASKDGTARIWDSKNGHMISPLIRHKGSVVSAKFSHNGKLIVTASEDGTARIWDAETGALLNTLAPKGWEVWSADFDSNGSRVITATQDGTASIWNTATAKVIHKLTGHRDSLWSACFSPDGKKAVTIAADGMVKIWDADSGVLIHTLMPNRVKVDFALFDPSGTRIVSSSEDGTIRIWELKTGQLLHQLLHPTVYDRNAALYACFSLDGRFIFSFTSHGGNRWKWDASTGAHLKEKAPSVPYENCLRGNRTVGKYYLDIDQLYNSVDILDMQSGAVAHSLIGHTDIITSASFSPNGNLVVSSSWDGTAKVWDAHTGDCLMTLYCVAGMSIQSVNLQNTDNNFTDQEKVILRQYGAII